MIRRYIIEGEDSLKGFHEAIEKLEREWGAEEIEPCEDCISREAVLAKVNEYASIWTSWNDGMSKEQIAREALTDAKETVIQMVKDLPSVQATRPKGEWIIGEYETWVCSVCGERPLNYTGFIPTKEQMKERWHFCSVCGADMRESETE